MCRSGSRSCWGFSCVGPWGCRRRFWDPAGLHKVHDQALPAKLHSHSCSAMHSLPSRALPSMPSSLPTPPGPVLGVPPPANPRPEEPPGGRWTKPGSAAFGRAPGWCCGWGAQHSVAQAQGVDVMECAPSTGIVVCVCATQCCSVIEPEEAGCNAKQGLLASGLSVRPEVGDRAGLGLCSRYSSTARCAC